MNEIIQVSNTEQSKANSGHDINATSSENLLEKVMLDRNEIHPRQISNGETELVLQRHGKYIRDRENPNVGELTPEAEQLETESALRYFTELIAQVPENERKGINVLFVASDTRYAGNGQRSYQTTEIARRVAEQLFRENDIPLENILNITPDLSEKSMVIPELREPQMFEQTPEFVEFMKQKHGDLDKDFWIAFEEDTEAETRLTMGAEGPDEIADRLKYTVALLANYSIGFHQENPDSRLIVWAGTHYDTISPFVKRDILHNDKTVPVLVDYGGGVVIDIDQAGQATAAISGNSYSFSVLDK